MMLDAMREVLARGAAAVDVAAVRAVAAELEQLLGEHDARRCVWERCPRPEELPLRRGAAPPIHAACRRARNDAARCCTFAGCPTPDVLLGEHARKYGHRRHVGCVALSRRKPRASTCACGRVLAGPSSRWCAPCGRRRRAGGHRAGGRGSRAVVGRSAASEALRATGQSLAVLGSVLGCSPVSVQRWRAGHATPGPEHRELIAARLGIDAAGWSVPAGDNGTRRG